MPCFSSPRLGILTRNVWTGQSFPWRMANLPHRHLHEWSPFVVANETLHGFTAGTNRYDTWLADEPFHDDLHVRARAGQLRLLELVQRFHCEPFDVVHRAAVDFVRVTAPLQDLLQRLPRLIPLAGELLD